MAAKIDRPYSAYRLRVVGIELFDSAQYRDDIPHRRRWLYTDRKS